MKVDPNQKSHNEYQTKKKELQYYNFYTSEGKNSYRKFQIFSLRH